MRPRRNREAVPDRLFRPQGGGYGGDRRLQGGGYGGDRRLQGGGTVWREAE